LPRSEDNSADKLLHISSVAYSVKLVLLNKNQILGGRACMHCYRAEKWVLVTV